MQRECVSKHTYVATADGGYISTSDVEDGDIAAANIIGDDNDHETSEEENCRTLQNCHCAVIIEGTC
jgi:hypothetical protein